MKFSSDPVFDFRAPKTDQEFYDVTDLLSLAFGEDEEPKDPRDMGLMPEQFVCAYDGEHLASTSAAFAFDMSMNGKWISADGVTIVSTDPAYRRKGLVRAIISQLLHKAHDNGKAFSILWASMGAIYQRFGYGHASDWNFYSIAPRDIVLRDKIPLKGFARRIKDRKQALAMANDIYNKSVEGSTLAIRRNTIRWDFMFPKDEKKAPTFTAWFDENGEPTGYMMHVAKAGAGDDGFLQNIRVTDLIATNMDAYRGLWSYLGGHDLGKTISMNYRPDHEPITTLLLEPRALNKKVFDGIWMRVVDVEKALTERGYDHDGQVSIAVENDDICPWNQGAWSLTVKNGFPTVVKIDPAEADFTITIQALASLLCGYRNASHLCMSEQMTARDGVDTRAADMIFSTRYRPNCSNMF